MAKQNIKNIIQRGISSWFFYVGLLYTLTIVVSMTPSTIFGASVVATIIDLALNF
jgi:hypothetical protein